MSSPKRTNRPSKSAVCLTAFALAAAGCRIAAARGDLSFDEIWSWTLARNSTSAPEILFLQLDNNHILNTLVMYALGPGAPSLAYRLPAVVASCAGLWFGFLIARRNSAGPAVLILLGASHVLILYGSEARGYAYLTGCTLSAWWALEQYLDREQFWSRALFALCCTLGFLAQLPFAFAYCGFFAYSGLRMLRRRHRLVPFLLLHAWPCVAVIAVYAFYVDGLFHGGGDRFPLSRTLVATLSLFAGGPQRGIGSLVATAIATILLGVALIFEFRLDRARGLLYVTAMFIAPAAVIAVSGFDIVYPRHFLVPMIFGYMAVGCQLARWFARGKNGRLGVTALLLAFVACNAAPVARLVARGRSPDSDVLFWITERTEGPVVKISGDHDFRVGMTVLFHFARNAEYFQSSGKRVEYVESENLSPEGTEWRLRHLSSEWEAPPGARITDARGNEYHLVQTFPARSPSGWTWFVYRRTQTPELLDGRDAQVQWRARDVDVRAAEHRGAVRGQGDDAAGDFRVGADGGQLVVAAAHFVQNDRVPGRAAGRGFDVMLARPAAESKLFDEISRNARGNPHTRDLSQKRQN